MLKKLLSKLLIVCILLTSLIFASTSVTLADYGPPIDVLVCGKYIKLSFPILTPEGRAYAPVKDLANALGADSVSWDEASSSVIVKMGSRIMYFKEGATEVIIGSDRVKLNGYVMMVNDTVYVPVIDLTEHMGASLAWEGSKNAIRIEKECFTLSDKYIDYDYYKKPSAENNYTENDLMWLAKMVHAESKGESMKGKIAVANVILNRVKNPGFPKTIYGVIFDRKFGVQFTPIINGSIYNTPSSDSIEASRRALSGENPVGNSLYFMNPRIATTSWISSNRRYYTTIGSHSFYL